MSINPDENEMIAISNKFAKAMGSFVETDFQYFGYLRNRQRYYIGSKFGGSTGAAPVLKKLVKEEPKKKEPVEISEDKVLDTKFTLSVQTMIAAGTGLASLIGMWYTLHGEIEEAKELPAIDIEKIFSDEYPSKPEGHNWPRSYEQYKTQVGQLQEDMDEVFEQLEEYEETIDELEKQVTNLRVKVGSK